MKPKILVLGGGFGGLYTALAAHKRLGDRADITLMDRNDYFLFAPLLHQVVSNSLQPHHVSRSLSRLLPREVRFVQASAQAIHLEDQTVETDRGVFPYDYLVIALGAVPNYYGMTSVAEHALPFKGLPDALQLRERILQRFAEATLNPDRAAELLRTVVTGAGCTGVELVSELHDWMTGPLLHDFPTVPKEAVTLALAEAMDGLLCPTNPDLAKQATEQLNSRDISLQFKAAVQDAGPNWMRVKHGDEVQTEPFGTMVWAAGIKPNPVIADLPVTFDRRGRIIVSETLQVPDHPEVFAIGDLAACPIEDGKVNAPATAQVAVQQAPVTARNLEALITGLDLVTFKYKNLGEVVEMGPTHTLTEAFGKKFTGVTGWLLGRTIHLARLPDWGDRASVAWEWTKQRVGIG
jgi:NADH dehydrogenase